LGEAKALQRGEEWGASDGAEVCLATGGPTPGPTIVIHGFTTGHHESVTEAGTPPVLAATVGGATRFSAQVGERQWVGEWAIPWAAIGVRPQPGLKLAFNVGVRRVQTDEWVIWVGALGQTWRLENAGFVVLE